MFYSPLRYPGGKGKILNFMKELIIENNLSNSEYVEPYAGGASIAMGLLIEGFVSKIHINDLDKGVYFFWWAILNKTNDFIAKIETTELTINEWKKQRNIYNNVSEYNKFEVGFATFFLNRCNFSGVIKGGPIGGLEQNGTWKLDARFNKPELIKRIEKIAKYKTKIKLYNKDTLRLLKSKEEQFKNAILYLDPPYFVKGNQLYKNHYKAEDHEKIVEVVKNIKAHWVVSYDNVPQICKLYNFARSNEFDIKYSAGKTKSGHEIMFFSDSLIIPDKKVCG